ncbi:PAW domain-containing protein [Caenorhabditis elegans]|uniref:PAW domain-containing protein n=1 Tax=Caenorhabditis elegans TaxID=6239 RepID=O45199_CAEEL|nr:PAW domain-containing protein [Caenorhabditis elegans]CCD74022.1 PAW domain-containing protein [Caenorhabditis elegans]|eukprot:NP_500056.2 Uncharacterized protein CELE_W09G12.8 [Caenorhabditis elegans]
MKEGTLIARRDYYLTGFPSVVEHQFNMSDEVYMNCYPELESRPVEFENQYPKLENVSGLEDDHPKREDPRPELEDHHLELKETFNLEDQYPDLKEVLKFNDRHPKLEEHCTELEALELECHYPELKDVELEDPVLNRFGAFEGSNTPIKLSPQLSQSNYVEFTYDVVTDTYSQHPKHGFLAQAFKVKNVQRVEKHEMGGYFFGYFLIMNLSIKTKLPKLARMEQLDDGLFEYGTRRYRWKYLMVFRS